MTSTPSEAPSRRFKRCPARRSTALTTASAKIKFVSGISLAATFEGEFADETQSYAGKGVMHYVW
jgi:hypothetical protein